jgi:hypothetical protein
MAVMQSRDNRTFIAGENLSTAQFKFVTLESTGSVILANSAGEQCIGVCLVGAASGNAVTVTRSGSVMVIAGGNINAGAAITTTAAGLALTAAAGNTIMGYAKEGGVLNQVIEIELISGGNVVPTL